VTSSPDKPPIVGTGQLEEALSEPTPGVIDALASLDGDIVILGVGGKMGPTLARMARRASDAVGIRRRVVGVSRFSDSRVASQLHSWGVETVSCDLLDRAALAALPDAPNVIFMAGMKFGSTGQESMTWAMNSFLPGLVCERYPASRIAAFSTGNIYGLSPVSGGGSVETDTPNPMGEYAMSCLGRERIFEHFSRRNETRISMLRLNYSTELRYGVLVDIARRVYAGDPVPLSMGYLNAIWQGDACAMSLQSLACASVPSFVINIAGPELLSVRRVAEQFGELWHKPVRFEGEESGDALLSDAKRAYDLFGRPRVDAEQMIRWIADWVAGGGETLARPTHFEERSGRF
jgi:hypothetical protein